MPEKKMERVTIKLEKNLVATHSSDLRAEVLALFEKGHNYLVLDMGGVEMIDSSGLAVLISTQNSLNRKAGQFQIINVSNEIMNMFKIMRLDHHLRVQGRE